MTCTRGKANPTGPTKLRLFADSGGFCQKPDCLSPLFVDVNGAAVSIAELAHIFAATDGGPRSSPKLSPAERGAYDNIILLCPSCHTVIDKAPSAFPDSVLREWKMSHTARIHAAFSKLTYTSRKAACDALQPLLLENATIFQTYGPNTEHSSNPESEMAALWKRKVVSKIIPNNQRVLSILDANRHLLTSDEQSTLEHFRQHVDDLTARHVGDSSASAGKRFPARMSALLVENE